MIVALHAPGEVGVGDGGEDFAGFGEAAIGRHHQGVDRLGEGEQLGIAEVGRDMLGEVAVDGGAHHLGDTGLQPLHGDRPGFTPGGGMALLLGHVAYLDAIGTETVDGARQGADLIAARGAVDLDLEIAGGEFFGRGR